MSFGSETGRGRSGSKGFSSKEKKLRRKKQEFHTHKKSHLREEEQVDPERVRERTIIALDRLGHQVLSTEPGGYDLHAWLRSLNALLDDFQERLGADRLSQEFLATRQRVAQSLGPFTVPEDINKEIEALNKEAAAARASLDELERKAGAKLFSLREEREETAKSLKAKKERLAAAAEARRARSLFSRMLNTGPSTAEAERAVAEADSKLKRLEEDIETWLKTRSVAGGRSLGEFEAARLELLKRLEEIQKRLEELRAAEETKLQLAREREEATKALGDVIRAMAFKLTEPGEGAVQEA